jgi:uncharacterized protein
MKRIPSGELFPTDDPIPAGELIGREEDVEEITAALEAATNLVIAAPRRTGKTTVCDAAIDQLRRRGAYTASIDLWQAADLTNLAEAIVTQTVANRPTLKRLLHDVRAKGRRALSNAQVRAIATLSGELGEDIEMAFEPGFAQRDPERYWDYALRLPQEVAQKDGRRLVLFLDEFQSILDFEDSNAQTRQQQMRAAFQRSSQVSFLFAGSIEHLMKNIFGENKRPFSNFGGFYELAPIASTDWEGGIRDRLNKDGCTIDETAIGRLIELGELHPRSTMLIAQQAHLASIFTQTKDIDSGLVEAGFQTARRRDRGKHEQTIDRIKKLKGKVTSRRALKVIHAIAHGEAIYTGGNSPDAEVKRAVNALHDAGIVESRSKERGWRIADPLFRLYVAEMDPARL